MEKKDIVKLLDDIFVPLDFKRKGNNWVIKGKELSKIVNLQKSNYGNYFYINYGFIIRGLELTTTTHVEHRLASVYREEQERITDLLDLETDIPMDQRLKELRCLITNKVLIRIQSVNTEEDLLNEIKKRPHLNDIPLVVKKYFDI